MVLVIAPASGIDFSPGARDRDFGLITVPGCRDRGGLPGGFLDRIVATLPLGRSQLFRPQLIFSLPPYYSPCHTHHVKQCDEARAGRAQVLQVVVEATKELPDPSEPETVREVLHNRLSLRGLPPKLEQIFLELYD